MTERNLTRNTRKSYRDTFALLLPFDSAKLRKPVDRLTVRDLTSRRLLDFLTHLEESRGCSVQTRNQRLTAIRAFARFVGSRDPVHGEWCGHIRAIRVEEGDAAADSMADIRRRDGGPDWCSADRKTQCRVGPNTHSFCFSTTAPTRARVSEAAQLKVSDLHVGRSDGGHALATLHGKGNKRRQCPLKATHRARVGGAGGRRRAASDTVFLSRYSKALYPVRSLSPCRAMRASRDSIGQKENNPCGPRHTALDRVHDYVG